MGTLFEKIAAGEIQAEIPYRDGKCFVLKDIHPQAPVHLLLIPLEPLAGISSADAAHGALLGHLLLVAKKMGEKFAPDGGFRLVINDGEAAGQTVPHLHIHLLAGRSFDWPPG
jgi:histidine triad (HIT) family protein